MAWRVPPNLAQFDSSTAPPQGSRVAREQRKLFQAARRTLEEICVDVRAGLSETVGIGVEFALGERASVVLLMPEKAPEFDPVKFALAIDMENVEAWCDEAKRIHVGLNPFHTTKDTDQTVLAITKVVHVQLGLHANDAVSTQPTTLLQRLFAAANEVVEVQRDLRRGDSDKAK
jgi:hypothetical protein